MSSSGGVGVGMNVNMNVTPKGRGGGERRRRRLNQDECRNGGGYGDGNGNGGGNSDSDCHGNSGRSDMMNAKKNRPRPRPRHSKRKPKQQKQRQRKDLSSSSSKFSFTIGEPDTVATRTNNIPDTTQNHAGAKAKKPSLGKDPPTKETGTKTTMNVCKSSRTTRARASPNTTATTIMMQSPLSSPESDVNVELDLSASGGGGGDGDGGTPVHVPLRTSYYQSVQTTTTPTKFLHFSSSSSCSSSSSSPTKSDNNDDDDDDQLRAVEEWMNYYMYLDSIAGDVEDLCSENDVGEYDEDFDHEKDLTHSYHAIATTDHDPTLSPTVKNAYYQSVASPSQDVNDTSHHYNGIAPSRTTQTPRNAYYQSIMNDSMEVERPSSKEAELEQVTKSPTSSSCQWSKPRTSYYQSVALRQQHQPPPSSPLPTTPCHGAMVSTSSPAVRNTTKTPPATTNTWSKPRTSYYQSVSIQQQQHQQPSPISPATACRERRNMAQTSKGRTRSRTQKKVVIKSETEQPSSSCKKNKKLTSGSGKQRTRKTPKPKQHGYRGGNSNGGSCGDARSKSKAKPKAKASGPCKNDIQNPYYRSVQRFPTKIQQQSSSSNDVVFGKPPIHANMGVSNTYSCSGRKTKKTDMKQEEGDDIDVYTDADLGTCVTASETVTIISGGTGVTTGEEISFMNIYGYESPLPLQCTCACTCSRRVLSHALNEAVSKNENYTPSDVGRDVYASPLAEQKENVYRSSSFDESHASDQVVVPPTNVNRVDIESPTIPRNISFQLVEYTSLRDLMVPGTFDSGISSNSKGKGVTESLDGMGDTFLGSTGELRKEASSGQGKVAMNENRRISESEPSAASEDNGPDEAEVETNQTDSTIITKSNSSKYDTMAHPSGKEEDHTTIPSDDMSTAYYDENASEVGSEMLIPNDLKIGTISNLGLFRKERSEEDECKCSIM